MHSRRFWPSLQLATLLLLYTCSALAEGTNAVVFIYHRFGESNYPSTNVKLDQFDDHLQHLADAGYQVWPLERIVDHLRSGKSIPDRAVAISVDDAYLSVYTEAYPRLKRRGWPFTVFVSTDAVDRRLPAFMSWDQMREMGHHGAVFANHSASHDYLIRRHPGESAEAWRQRVRQDILHAQDRLETELGGIPMLFAYPYGEYNTALADIVEDLGFTAFGQVSGAIGPGADLRALPRFPMAEDYAGSAEFRAKAASLALPVLDLEPWDPLIAGTAAPLLRVTLAVSDARLDALRCYDSHGDRIDVHWITQQDKSRTFTVRSPQAAPPGRSRYNCTAPSSKEDRYYWFSHLWIRPAGYDTTPSGDRPRKVQRYEPP